MQKRNFPYYAESAFYGNNADWIFAFWGQEL